MGLFSSSKNADDIARKERAAKIIVTTCDFNKPYEVLGPVYSQVSNVGLFSSSFDKLEKEYKQTMESMSEKGLMTQLKIMSSHTWAWQNMFERAFYLAIEELKVRAEFLGADAIVGMRQDIDLANDSSAHFYLQMYGTAVKFK